MSYCKYCNDILKITKNKKYNEDNIVELDASGLCELLIEKMNSIIGMYNNDEYIYNIKFDESEIITVNIDKLEKLYPEKSELEIRSALKTIHNNIINEGRTSELFMFVCTTCGISYNLKANTIVDSLNLEESLLIQDEIPEIRFEDPTLFRTKDYICINKKCTTNTDKSDESQIAKEAAFYKLGKAHNVRYICGCCKMSWTT